MSNLTDKQEKFCQEYLVDLNATKSAIRAGYSEKTAHSIGAENLIKPEILDRLSELNKSRLEATGISQKRVLEEYAKIAFSDVRKVLTVDGGLRSIDDIDDDTAGAIAAIESFDEISREGEKLGTNRKIKLHDKLRALEALSKHLGLFEKDNSQKVIETPKQVIIINGKEVEF